MGALKNKQHENFCRALIAGKNQKQAAIAAGYKPKYAKVYGNRLSSRAEIRERLKEFNQAANSECIMSVIERKATLSAIARATSQTKTGSIAYGDNIRAIAELNRMEGIGSWGNDVNCAQAFIPISQVEFRMNLPD
jgi:hypothetical protein